MTNNEHSTSIFEGVKMAIAIDRHLTYEEMEAGLDHIRQSPKDGGAVEMIVIRPDHDERVLVTTSNVTPEDGFAGDDWKTYYGEYPEIQVTLMNCRATALLAQHKERWPLAGDQLYVDFDLSDENLPPGSQFQIGSAIFQVSAKPHTGCAKFAARFGTDATKFVNSPEGKRLHLRGINARVVQAGTVSVGDEMWKVG
jgi:MOSC domain-containing protein YiiM